MKMADSDKMPWVFRGGIPATLFFCISTLALYMAGGSFTDKALFSLLRLLRFLACLLVILSLCALGTSIFRMAQNPHARHLLNIALCLFSGILGAALLVFSSFIAMAAEGSSY
jgi:hypothetical protein